MQIPWFKSPLEIPTEMYKGQFTGVVIVMYFVSFCLIHSCPAGTFGSKERAKTCTLCGKDTFSSKDG